MPSRREKAFLFGAEAPCSRLPPPLPARPTRPLPIPCPLTPPKGKKGLTADPSFQFPFHSPFRKQWQIIVRSRQMEAARRRHHEQMKAPS